MSLVGKKVAEDYSKSASLDTWAENVVLRTELPLADAEGKKIADFQEINHR